MAYLKGPRTSDGYINVNEPVNFQKGVLFENTLSAENPIGDTHFVRNNGNDGNNGISVDNCFKTLAKAVSVAAAWDRIIFLPATDSSAYLVEAVEGTDDANIPITISAAKQGLKILGPLNMTQWGSPSLHTHVAGTALILVDANQVEIGGIAFHIQAASGGIEFGSSTNIWRPYLHDCYFGGNSNALFGAIVGNTTGSGLGGYHRGYPDTIDAPCALVERCTFMHINGPGLFFNAGYGSTVRDCHFAVAASRSGIQYYTDGTSRPFAFILNNKFTAVSNSTSTGIVVTNTPSTGYLMADGNSFVGFGSDDLCMEKRTGLVGLNYNTGVLLTTTT